MFYVMWKTTKITIAKTNKKNWLSCNKGSKLLLDGWNVCWHITLFKPLIMIFYFVNDFVHYVCVCEMFVFCVPKMKTKLKKTREKHVYCCAQFICINGMLFLKNIYINFVRLVKRKTKQENIFTLIAMFVYSLRCFFVSPSMWMCALLQTKRWKKESLK